MDNEGIKEKRNRLLEVGGVFSNKQTKKLYIFENNIFAQGVLTIQSPHNSKPEIIIFDASREKTGTDAYEINGLAYNLVTNTYGEVKFQEIVSSSDSSS